MSEIENAYDKLTAMTESIHVSEPWEIKGRDGKNYTVKETIPYEELEKAALERAGMVYIEDEEDGVAIRVIHEDPVNCYIFCKYYTDIPTDGLEGDLNKGIAALFDYVRKNRIVDDPHWLWRHPDWAYLADMSEKAILAMKDIFDKKHAPMSRLEKLMASLPDDQDAWAKELATSKEVNDQMIDLLGLKAEDDKKKNMMSLVEFAKTDK